MPSTVGSLCRAATRREGEPLNVLTFPTHEAYQTCLARTGHRFFLVQGPGIKTWDARFRPVPPGHVLLDPAKGNRQVPAEEDFDLVLSQNKFGQFAVAAQLSRQLHLPLVSLEHTLPPDSWGKGGLRRARQMRGHVNLFISEYSRRAWGWAEGEALVVHHGIDTTQFRPPPVDGGRRPVALSVVNDWVNRDYFCGYTLWKKATEGLPVRVLGDTPGLSQPAPSVDALAAAYRTSLVFVNTSLVSPVPTALLEAMASGCAVVTTGTCMIPEVVEDGTNGLLADTPAAIRSAVGRLLADPDLAAALGREARRTVEEKFSLGRFVTVWDRVLRDAADITYTGNIL